MKYVYLFAAVGFYESMAGLMLYLGAGALASGTAAVWGVFFPVMVLRFVRKLADMMPAEKNAEVDPENRELFLTSCRNLGNDILAFAKSEKWNGYPPTLVKESKVMEKDKQKKKEVHPKREIKREKETQNAVREAKYLIEQEKKMRAKENKRQTEYYLMINKANQLAEKRAWTLSKAIYEECMERAESEFEQRYCRNKIQLCEVQMKNETYMEK